MGALLKVLALLLATAGAGAGGYFIWTNAKLAAELPPLVATPETEVAAVEGGEGPHGAAPAGGEHGAPAGGEHGAAAPAAGHGEAAPAGHGAGGAAAAPVRKGASLVSFDEVFVNVNEAPSTSHSLALKLELEIFEEQFRTMIDKKQALVKSAIIETTRAQDYAKLNTIAGKLYFKEVLISQINQSLGQAAVRDLHFSSFYLQ